MEDSNCPESHLERHRRLQAENREAFRDAKTKLTYYVASLPFALAAAAIASFPYPEHWSFVVIELVAWLALLSAGAAGLKAKYAETEHHRLRSLQSGAAVDQAHAGTKRTEAEAKVSSDREGEIRKMEDQESRAHALHKRLLILGCSAWVVSRSVIAIASTVV